MRPLTARGRLDADLKQLRQRLLLMGARVEDMIGRSAQALVERDIDAARATILLDRKVNLDEVEIDEMCLRMLLSGSPRGADLRFLAFAMKVVTDMERIGDLAVNICERAVELSADGNPNPYLRLPEMARCAADMLGGAIDAFVHSDQPGARSVIHADDELDELYHAVFRERMAEVKAGTLDPERAVRVQNVAKYLERIGDHCTNIAEHVIFLVEGTDIRHAGRRAVGG